ncbi:LacI family transcriptional regulator [Paenibacillus baekrokdamisoli]|uniref:LacI family transcriptional regulator n=1 Tax=Paenibacillus baekrokdamisoli TaxID=1712516 RepID=A0A3G9J6Y4_9BACL|nr:LacI family DNA-binding transcriptional regulator [Paenibacillus baekrokdamisoli]MBB3071952.1 LacI family sucrose operon transcriptional repressor [Paenibacillus baekrokdamisoli]BBH24065.1 LacI family transcriptional regulator [Paenibacillus baekrokdamisoli]
MATIKDIAEKVGVTVTSVSRVLNNRGYISEMLKKKVHEAMEELNYQPNEVARSLIRKKSNIIGLIIPDVSHPFFGEVTYYIEYYADKNGYKLLLCNSKLNKLKEKEYINMLKGSQVDGIIMGSHTMDTKDYTSIKLPMVTLDRQITDTIPYISSDNYKGGELATNLLIKKGCKKIAHISGNLHLNLLAKLRHDAFKKVILNKGIEHIVLQTDLNGFNYDEYEQLVSAMFQEHPDIDGVFASSDIIAAQVLKECYRIGKSVPQDVKIVGYDGIQLGQLITPGITTIKQPTKDIGKMAVSLIIEQIEGEDVPKENILPVKLIERQST